ncbi:hypothetical protein A2U01_0010560 [Trifolium medium]|uniref:Uncharacterized protein n=1 Tax=Trifolium medium TaxID=97028 RepID=A0A392MQ78_9FABA|nr:hypothetical protein [Trifolium medium]
MLSNPLIPITTSPPLSKFSVSGLMFLSFHHLLLLSFYVSMELVPNPLHDMFMKDPNHTVLLSILCCFEAFFGFTFLTTMPVSEENYAVEHICLLFANGALAGQMIYLIDHPVLFWGILCGWSLAFIIDFCYLAKDIWYQICSKISPCCISSCCIPRSKKKKPEGEALNDNATEEEIVLGLLDRINQEYDKVQKTAQDIKDYFGV